MKFVCASILALALIGSSTVHSNSDRAQERPPGPVEIELPVGDVHLRHDETLKGMMFTITSGPIEIRARRVYIGDGKNAAKYEASNFGMKTPLGLIKKGAIKLEDGATITTDSDQLSKWGVKSNEVYLLVPNLRLGTKSNDES